MAGRKGRGGRPAKPAAIRIADGTHRKDRHGSKSSALAVAGVPQKPHFSSPDAETLWETTIKQLIDLGIAAEIDAAMLQSMCELWGLYRQSYAVAEVDPTDKDARIAVVAYWGKFEQAAARFGMNASDRARLRIEPKSKGVRRRDA